MRFFSRPSITPLFIHVFIYYCVGEEEENENKNKKNKNKKNKNKGDDKDNKKNNKNKNGKSVFIHGVYFIVLLNLIPSLKLILCLVSSIRINFHNFQQIFHIILATYRLMESPGLFGEVGYVGWNA